MELKQDGFSHSTIKIQTGERIWFQWKTSNDQNNHNTDHVETLSHSVVLRRICTPLLRHDDVIDNEVVCESMGPPTASGLMSFVFEEVGNIVLLLVCFDINRCPYFKLMYN